MGTGLYKKDGNNSDTSLKMYEKDENKSLKIL